MLLSGCGFKDGSEIHEATLAYLAIAKKGFEVDFFSLCEDQSQSFNHRTATKLKEVRNIADESARIARGKIQEIKNCRVEDFDALVIPGGFGVALNFCSFANDGEKMVVHPDVENIIFNFYTAKKCIAAICIAPILLAKVLGEKGIKITLGATCDASAIVEKWGAKHITCEKGGFVKDMNYKIYTTPAYMYGESTIDQVNLGIESMFNDICH